MAKKITRRARAAADVRSLRMLAKKKNTGGEHCSNPKAVRGCYAAKSIQHRIVIGFARLRVLRQTCRGKTEKYATLTLLVDESK